MGNTTSENKLHRVDSATDAMRVAEPEWTGASDVVITRPETGEKGDAKEQSSERKDKADLGRFMFASVPTTEEGRCTLLELPIQPFTAKPTLQLSPRAELKLGSLSKPKLTLAMRRFVRIAPVDADETPFSAAPDVLLVTYTVDGSNMHAFLAADYASWRFNEVAFVVSPRWNQPLSLIDASEGHAFVSIIANTLDIDQKMRVGRAVNVRLLRDNIPVRVGEESGPAVLSTSVNPRLNPLLQDTRIAIASVTGLFMPIVDLTLEYSGASSRTLWLVRDNDSGIGLFDPKARGIVMKTRDVDLVERLLAVISRGAELQFSASPQLAHIAISVEIPYFADCNCTLLYSADRDAAVIIPGGPSLDMWFSRDGGRLHMYQKAKAGEKHKYDHRVVDVTFPDEAISESKKAAAAGAESKGDGKAAAAAASADGKTIDASASSPAKQVSASAESKAAAVSTLNNFLGGNMISSRPPLPMSFRDARRGQQAPPVKPLPPLLESKCAITTTALARPPMALISGGGGGGGGSMMQEIQQRELLNVVTGALVRWGFPRTAHGVRDRGDVKFVSSPDRLLHVAMPPLAANYSSEADQWGRPRAFLVDLRGGIREAVVTELSNADTLHTSNTWFVPPAEGTTEALSKEVFSSAQMAKKWGER